MLCQYARPSPGYSSPAARTKFEPLCAASDAALDWTADPTSTTSNAIRHLSDRPLLTLLISSCLPCLLAQLCTLLLATTIRITRVCYIRVAVHRIFFCCTNDPTIAVSTSALHGRVFTHAPSLPIRFFQIVTTTTMRVHASIAIAAVAALTTVSRAALINLPTLYSCEPASIHILAKGNYTIEGRDGNSHKLVFRARIKKGVLAVTWDTVDLPANATALITVIDQISPTDTSNNSVQGSIFANPAGNTTCLAKARDHRSSAKQKTMVPTIIGIALGAFMVLVLLLIGGMLYRRRKEKSEKIEQDSVDLNHSYTQGSIPAGGSYMARLVPGLKLQEARPLPRDPVLESEHANYASTRRGTYYYKNGAAPDILAYAPSGSSFELPKYNHKNTQAYHHQSTPSSTGADPFSSQVDLGTEPFHHHQQRPLYQHKDWDESQTSFLSKKPSP